MFERRERQRDAVRDGERRDDEQQLPDRCRRAAAARPGTAGGPGRSGCGGCPPAGTCWTTASAPWRVPAKYSNDRAVFGRESPARQRRPRRRSRTSDAADRRETSSVRPSMHPAGLPAAKRARRRIDCRSGSASGADHAASCRLAPSAATCSRSREQLADRIRAARQRVCFEQLFGRLNLQVVGEVERMRDDRQLDRARIRTRTSM